MDGPETCAALARAHDEPLAGTAPVALGWLAIEVPGPWGRSGLTESALDVGVARPLTDATAGSEVRIQLLRRPRTWTTTTSPTASSRRRTVFLAHAGAEPWCERLELDDAELAGLDPEVCASATPPGLGQAHTEPLLLVCTHARRDRCCATLGRPVADTLAALHPDLVWETSHTGGHRFAANLVVLPDGLVYGGLDVASAVETSAIHLAGGLDVAHLRGRSSLTRAGQAAEVFIRRELALSDGRVTVVDVATEEQDRFVASVRSAAGEHQLVLASAPAGPARRVSCDRDDAEEPVVFRLVEVRRG